MKSSSIGFVVLCVVTLVVPYVSFAQVSGTVKDQATQTPIPEALVTLQATQIQTTTDAQGVFSLPDAVGTDLRIVSARKGYYNNSVVISGPATDVEILLESVPQDDDPNYHFQNPSACLLCHPDQLNQWEASPMARAGVNRWVYDIYNGTGTAGGQGGFVYIRDSAHAGSNPSSECASCHQPESWVANPFTALEDIDNLSLGAMHGISCEVCHKIAHIDESKKNFPGLYPGTVTITRPSESSTQVQYGVLGDTDYVVPAIMRPSHQPQLSAAVCAACHQDKNDPDGDGLFEEDNGVISEPTYLEWLDSPFGDPESDKFATCVSCHMPSYGSSQVCQQWSANPPIRDPETVRSHLIEGTTPQYLENAVEMTMTTQESDSTISVDVVIHNNQTGHHVPTGVTIRNMILVIDAWRESDGQPLAYLGNQTIHDLGGIGDPAQGNYAGLPGRLYAKVNHDASGHGPTFFTEATGIQFDNRIPALASDSTHYTFRAPLDEDTYHVRARLIYRRSFKFLADAKGWTEDGHGNPLADVQAPHFGHLMEESKWASNDPNVGTEEQPPVQFTLEQNYPNPANLSTTIRFELHRPGDVSLKIYDVLGREISTLVSGSLSAGTHTVDWNAEGLPGGIYFYRLRMLGIEETKQFILTR